MIYGKILSRSWIPFVIIVNTRVNPQYLLIKHKREFRLAPSVFSRQDGLAFPLTHASSLRIQMLVVLGAQWGDEGKGKLSIFSQKMPIWLFKEWWSKCRTHNSSQRKEYVFTLIPSGILWEGKTCIIGNGCVVHLPTLLDELRSSRSGN